MESLSLKDDSKFKKQIFMKKSVLKYTLMCAMRYPSSQKQYSNN